MVSSVHVTVRRTCRAGAAIEPAPADASQAPTIHKVCFTVDGSSRWLRIILRTNPLKLVLYFRVTRFRSPLKAILISGQFARPCRCSAEIGPSIQKGQVSLRSRGRTRLLPSSPPRTVRESFPQAPRTLQEKRGLETVRLQATILQFYIPGRAVRVSRTKNGVTRLYRTSRLHRSHALTFMVFHFRARLS